MADVSKRLREAREQAGLDIHDIAATTRIKPAFLLALEAGTFEKLPSHFYVRTFLRAYARELGLDPDEMAAEYEAGRQPVASAPQVPLPQTPVRGFARQLSDRRPLQLSGNLWPVAALALALLVVVRMSGSGSDPVTTAGEPGAVGTSGTSAPAVAGSQGAEGSVASPGDPGKLTIEITPTDAIWVAATADGERAVYRMLKAGERVRVEAREAVAFRIGNAGAFEYSINGAPGKPVGRAGEVREFQVTSANYRNYRR